MATLVLVGSSSSSSSRSSSSGKYMTKYKYNIIHFQKKKVTVKLVS